MMRNLVGAALLLAACTPGSPADLDVPAQVRVQLDVFSGRVNPEWQLNASEDAAVRSRLRDLPSAAAAPEVAQLGYRGFLLLDPVSAGNEDSVRIRVWAGVIMVTQGSRVAWYRDAHGLEELLKQQARARGYADVVPA